MAASSHDWSWDTRMGFWRLGEIDDRRVIEIKSPEGRPSQLSVEELEALLRTLTAPAGEP
jgi:hypothetical protein